MSIMCVAKRAEAERVMLRISADYSNEDMDSAAEMLAKCAEEILLTDGSTIFSNTGRWKNESENGRAVEIISYHPVTQADLEVISRYVNVTIGMTCFATVDPTTVYELYELAE